LYSKETFVRSTLVFVNSLELLAVSREVCSQFMTRNS